MMTTTITVRAAGMADLMARYYDRPKFLEYCKECPNYGNRWSCPPYDFEPESLLRKYGVVNVIGVQVLYDEATRAAMDTKEKVDAYTLASLDAVKQPMLPALLTAEHTFPGSMAFISGNCKVCAVCARETGGPCLHPDQMRYSLESLGFDVGALTQDVLGITIVWTPGQLPAYYTLVAGLAADTAAEDQVRDIIEQGLSDVRQP